MWKRQAFENGMELTAMHLTHLNEGIEEALTKASSARSLPEVGIGVAAALMASTRRVSRRSLLGGWVRCNT